MRDYKIAVLPGDGIGIDVTAEAVKVLKAVAALDGGIDFEFQEFPWGSQYYLEHGEMMPKDALDILAGFNSILLGAVGDPAVPDHVTLWGMLLPIRQCFQEYVNLRPAKLLPGIESPLRGKRVGDIDIVFVRENMEGEYSGVGGRLYQGTPAEVALQTGVFTRYGTERIIRYAFEIARKRPKKHLTSVTKSNACSYSMVFWDEVFKEVGKEYPDVHTDQYLVDAMAASLILHPEKFDVVVASNLFGDILTDIGSAIIGSMGLGASANIDATLKHPSMFEPIHGSAPDIMGMGIANPLAAIGAAKMLLEHHGEYEMAEVVSKVIEQQVAEQKILTPDLGGTAKTWEVGDDLVRRILAT